MQGSTSAWPIFPDLKSGGASITLNPSFAAEQLLSGSLVPERAPIVTPHCTYAPTGESSQLPQPAMMRVERMASSNLSEPSPAANGEAAGKRVNSAQTAADRLVMPASHRPAAIATVREEALHFFPQVRDRLAVSREMPQQASLEQPIKQRIEGAPGDDRLSATKGGKAGRDAPHHVLQALVDLGDVVAKGLFKQRLRAKVVPEAMHPGLVANRLAKLFQKTLHQFVAALRR